MHSYKSIRLRYLILSVVTGSCLLSSCSKDRACPPSNDLGYISWSGQSQEWFPSSYFDAQTVLVFKDSGGNTNTFSVIYANVSPDNKFSILPAPCPDGDGVTQTQFGLAGRASMWVSSNGETMFIVGESEKKSGSFSAEPAGDFYDRLHIEMHIPQDPFESYLAKVSVITDFRNCIPEEIDPRYDMSVHHDSLLIGSTLYSDVYSSVTGSSVLGDLYVQPGKGIIGFVDQNGVLWLQE